MITIEIFVPNYLRSYLEKTYGTSYKANFNDELGVLILSILRKKHSYQYHYTPKSQEDYKDLVPYTICISMTYFEKEGCHIYEADRVLIAKSIDRWFRNNLFRYAVVNFETFGIPYKDTITKYLLKYNITEEELSYSTIRKDFNRKKELIKEHLNSQGTKKSFSKKEPKNEQNEQNIL